MKTRLAVLLFLAFVSTHLFGQNSEDENIKQLVIAESTAYFNHDADAWQSNWLHDENTNRTSVANGSYSAIKGWDNFGPQTVKWLKEHPKQSVEVKDDSFLIRSDGNLAWVDFKQQLLIPGTDSIVNTGRESRVLVKENSAWKILSLISYDPGSFNGNSPQDIENSLNNTGYNLLSANRINDAIEVFRLNVKLHPKAWNTYDSLGEALAVAGNKKEAIENYEKSVKLNPKNDNGKKAIEKLKAK